MKKLLLSCALLLALALPLYAVVGPPDIVTVRIREDVNVNVIITRGEGRSEILSFDKGITDKYMTRANEGYYKIFAQLYSEGYVLQSTITAQESPSISCSTLLFVKKP